MNLLQRYQTHIKAENLFSASDPLLLAVSGGVDSAVLCELCYQSGFTFSIAHCNFQLRGAESERDELFVRSIAEKYKVKLFVKTFETEQYAAENKLSIQEAARKLRYNWFAELINSRSSVTGNPAPGSRLTTQNWLLTAHHADDNIETLAMNFFRGTGISGLTGIPEKNDYIRRPLLSFTKSELLDFAKENKLDFAEDSSNDSLKYTRNFFRKEIIPAIEKVYPQVKENLLDNIERFKAIEELYQLSVQKIIAKLVKQKGTELHIPVKQLMGYHNRALIYEIIRPFGFTEKQVEEVLKLSMAVSGKYVESPAHTHRLIRHRHWFIISPVKAEGANMLLIEAGQERVRFAEGELRVQSGIAADFSIPGANTSALLDVSFIQFPLILRPWKPGDYFYPLGMKKKKKVARFLIDLKLSKTEKEKTWVLEMNKKIIWVVGHRIDDRFKIKPGTSKLLHLQFIASSQTE